MKRKSKNHIKIKKPCMNLQVIKNKVESTKRKTAEKGKSIDESAETHKHHTECYYFKTIFLLAGIGKRFGERAYIVVQYIRR